MLHAITHKKGILYRRYIGHRDEGTRVHEEDEITSLIFGPLSMLPQKLSGLFWHGLLREFGASNLPTPSPVNCRMFFWPSKVCNGRRIEPDLVVELDWANGKSASFLVEFKWKAPLSGEDQLHRQWLEYFTVAERENGWHLFIGLETSAATVAEESHNVWNGKLIKLDWIKILGFMSKTPRQGEFHDLLPWIEQITRAFERIGIKPFRGFSHIEPSMIRSFPTRVFWKGFKGFQGLQANIGADVNPSFFNSQGGSNV